MKPSAIYSKSGKGVQEASGKTSLLKRADRAVLSAIDGRATLSEVAQKVGKSFDAEFEKLIAMLDKEGFVREVAAAAAASTPSRPAVPPARAPAAKPAAPASSGGADDLDFTSIMPAIKPGTRTPPSKPAPPDPTATQRAKEQESALYKARQEAEARAQAERDRLRQEAEAKARSEAEAKLRAETEKKLREEAEAKVRAEAEAKARAAREAAVRLAAEAKAKAEAEAQAKIEAERKAREEAERKAREEAEKARREAEELRQRLEEERRAREEAERQRKEEEERRRREEEERRAREEAERKAREEEERKRREEEERRMREAEEQARLAREAQEQARLAREAEQARAQQARELAEARSRASQRSLEEERARRSQQETRTRQPTLPDLPPELRPEPAAPLGGGSLDALMADLDSFSQREEQERQQRDAAESRNREEKKRRDDEEAGRRAAAEEAARQARELAAALELERQRAAEEARRREEEAQRAQEEAERRVREAEERRNRAGEQRKRPKPADTDIDVSEADLGMDDVRRDEAAVAREARKAQREREREARQRAHEARSRAEIAAREEPVKYPKARRPVKWGRPLAIAFFVTLVTAVAALHVLPLPMADYEAAASEALGRPVRIGSAHLSLFTGVRLDLTNVTVGDRVHIAQVHAYPRIGSLFDDKKAFGRIELHGASVPQQAIGEAVAARLRGRSFEVERIVASNLKLEGPVPLPALEAEARVAADGSVRNLNLRGPESLDVKLSAAPNGEVEFDATAASLTVPFVPGLSLSSFAMKGTANRQGMKIASWGGAALDGVLSGNANVRWSSGWQIDGSMTARNLNAAVFAPALLSEGKVEATGRFSMSGPDPARLHQAARMEGNFTVGKGALGTFDLSRLLQTGGRQHGGRTPFTEMTGQASYDRGAVALRNVSISAGALTAGAAADIAPGGALAGRIVAEVRTTLQPLRATLVVGGTVKEPQVRN